MGMGDYPGSTEEQVPRTIATSPRSTSRSNASNPPSRFATARVMERPSREPQGAPVRARCVWVRPKIARSELLFHAPTVAKVAAGV